MKNNVLYIGLDVDDKRFHLSAICQETGEVFDFTTKPNSGSLVKKLKEFSKKGFAIKICYESTYLGNSLYRAIAKAGFDCEIIASSLIPKKPGHQVKTDRIDCQKLAIYYMKGLLTPIHVPTEDEEVDRDFIRTRTFLRTSLKALKGHILSMCRRADWNYREETGRKSYWSQLHLTWLEQKINKTNNKRMALNLSYLLQQFDQTKKMITSYDEEIERMSNEEKYKEKSDALLCYRGIETLTAMTLVTEIGDIKRFGHPKQLMSYVGLDVREYSSGGKERKFEITKLGNKSIRTCIVESCQNAPCFPRVSRQLSIRRNGIAPELIEISDRCMRRLHKKGHKMISRGKNVNKTKVACGREMIGFIWESLQAVS